MSYFQWTSALALGHAEIDEQHKRMLLLAEAVVEPLVNSREHEPDTAQLQLLIDFAREHFAFEEGVMRSVAYPGAEQHGKYHASLMTELRTHCDKMKRGQNTNPVGLLTFLWNWLLLHINSEDRYLVVWLESNAAGGNG